MLRSEGSNLCMEQPEDVVMCARHPNDLLKCCLTNLSFGKTERATREPNNDVVRVSAYKKNNTRDGA